ARNCACVPAARCAGPSTMRSISCASKSGLRTPLSPHAARSMASETLAQADSFFIESTPIEDLVASDARRPVPVARIARSNILDTEACAKLFRSLLWRQGAYAAPAGFAVIAGSSPIGRSGSRFCVAAECRTQGRRRENEMLKLFAGVGLALVSATAFAQGNQTYKPYGTQP